MPLDHRAALVLASVRDEPGTGLDVIDRVQTQGVTLHQGTVYPLLRTLKALGLLSCEESEPIPERGGRSRFLYRPTEAGLDALDAYFTETVKRLRWMGWVPRATPSML